MNTYWSHCVTSVQIFWIFSIPTPWQYHEKMIVEILASFHETATCLVIISYINDEYWIFEVITLNDSHARLRQHALLSEANKHEMKGRERKKSEVLWKTHNK